MVLLRPVTRTVISSTEFGQPVYDGIIRTGATRTGMQASLPVNIFSTLTWSTTVVDTGGFVTNPSTITIPTGKEGLYVAALVAEFTTSSGGSSMVSVSFAGQRYDTPVPSGGRIALTMLRPLAAGETVLFSVWNSHTVALTPTISRCDVYRVGL